MLDLSLLLSKLNIDKNKQKNLLQKKQVKKNCEDLFSLYENNEKLLFTLACTAPKNCGLVLIGKLINENVIKNDCVLRQVIKHSINNNELSFDDLKAYININSKTEDEIKSIISDECASGESRKNILIALKNKLPMVDSKFIMNEVNKFNLSESKKTKKDEGWLEEGEIRFLHKPGENKQLNEQILKNHLEQTKGMVVTRFPPEPNGVLHIGHAKAINIDFGFAEKHNGICYLRFDDTNPRNEDENFFQSIIDDVEWLGYKPYKITSSSLYFEKMFEFGEKLITKGKAYVCSLSLEEIRKRRKELSKAFEQFDEKSSISSSELAVLGKILSPFRDRSIDENLKLYKEMKEKKYKEGDYTLRFKMDLKSRNPLMFDLVGMRIIDEEHVTTKDKYNLYPSYEFALCVADSLENVTHSFCTREFFSRQESYNWLLDELEIYKPVQWEFSRLNLSNTVLSKRKIVPLKKFGIDLDDPRLYTIKGMRRRGIPPKAINNFVKSLSFTYSETIIDHKIFESFIRDELNRTAKRIMCVNDPIQVYVKNGKETIIKVSDEKDDTITFKPHIYIEKTDFKLIDTEGFLRFTPNQPVGLYLFGTIKFVEYVDNMIIAELTDELPKKYIHWVNCDSEKVELRLYESLFNSTNLEEGDYLKNINYDSVKVLSGYCDSRIKGCKVEDRFQFIRNGYYCVDIDSNDNKIVLNRTITLN